MSDGLTIIALMVLVGFGAEMGRHFTDAIEGIFKAKTARLIAEFENGVLDAALDAACAEVATMSDFDAATIRQQYIGAIREEATK